MGSTLDEVSYIYEDAKSLMGEREKDYEGSWREEGLASAISSAFKKGSQLKTMFLNGRYKENGSRTREDCLDGINYFVFAIRHMDLEKEENK